MLKAVIIDDETDSREILAAYLKRYCKDISVCGFGESVVTGLEAIREHNPDIVFLDIEMPYGNGFDLLHQAEPFEFETVFVTAFDNYAIQALNQSAAYYLLKPIDIEELTKAVDKIRRERADGLPRHTDILLDNLKNTAAQHQKVMLPTLEGFEVISVQSILYCEAVDNFTRFYFDDKKEMLICRTLKHYEEVLSVHRFIRIHRSYLVNPEFVVRYNKGKGGTVTMKNNRELDVSPSRKGDLIRFFSQ